MNPDGFEISVEGDSSSARGRANSHRVDLNRNFPDQYFQTNINGQQEPETEAVMSWSRSLPFVLSANLHGGSLVANYPFDDNPANQNGLPSVSPDDEVFRHLAKAYSYNHPGMHLGKPCHSQYVIFPDGITNGAQWYSVPGGMQDWNYLTTNDFEITVEVACFKFPPQKDLGTYWGLNRESLVAFMEQVHIGVKGFILDPNGNGVSNATIEVIGISHPVVSAKDGDYWRLLVPGDFMLQVDAPGYKTTSKAVKVIDGPATQLNFTLELDEAVTAWTDDIESTLGDVNQATTYLTNSQMDAQMADLENNYDVVEFLVNDSAWAVKVHAMKITAPVTEEAPASQKRKVLLIGGLYGSQPVGREMLMRLSRHLAQGWQVKNGKVVELLQSTEVYVVPAVDRKGFERVKEGVCGYTSSSEMWKEVGSLFHSEVSDGVAQAVVDMVAAVRPHVALSVEGGGVFMRYPYDSQNKKDPMTANEDLFQILTEAYARTHSTMLKNPNPCTEREPNSPTGIIHGQLIGVYKGSMLDYVYDNFGTFMVSAHISCCNYVKGSELPSLWQRNLSPLLFFIKSAHQGLKGQILDDKKHPLPGAGVSVDGNPVKLDKDATFNVFLPTGFHEVTVTSPGFAPKTTRIEVSAHMASDATLMLDSASGQSGGLEYHTWFHVEDLLNQMAVNYTSIARIIRLGLSARGLHIWGLEITPQEGANAGEEEEDAPQNAPKLKPAMLVLGGLGVSDWGGVEMAVQLANHLLSRYQTDSEVTRLIETRRIYVVPTINPGFMTHSVPGAHNDLTTDPMKPGTMNSSNPDGVQIDDSFYRDEGSTPPAEVKAFTKFISDVSPSLVMVLRGGAEGVAIPPSREKDGGMKAVDRESFESVGRMYSTAAKTPQENSSCGSAEVRLSAGVTADLNVKETKNSLLDFLFEKTSSFGIAIYYSCVGHPPLDALNEIWTRHRGALIKVLGAQDLAVRGFVTDQSGAPLPNTRVRLLKSNHPVYTDSVGGFWRPLGPGHHALVVHAPGYFPLTRMVDMVQGNPAAPVMVRLAKDRSVGGVPRSVFIIVIGTVVLILMLGLLCCVTLRSRHRRRNQYGVVHRSPKGHVETYADSSTTDDEFETLYVKAKKEKTSFLARDNLFSKKKDRFSAPYYDVALSSSGSDDEDEVFMAPFRKKDAL